MPPDDGSTRGHVHRGAHRAAADGDRAATETRAAGRCRRTRARRHRGDRSLVRCSRRRGSRWRSAAGSSSSRPASPSCPATRSASSGATAPARRACSGCSAARVEPAAGQVVRKGGFGYLPQDPRIAGVARRPHRGHPRAVGPRHRRASWSASRSCASRWRSDPTSATSRGTSRAEETFRIDGGYARRERGPVDGRRARARRGPHRPARSACCRGGERRRVELARILFAGSDVLCLDEPTNHLDVDAKEWLMGFLRSYRGALLVISHDLELLDEAITRVLHLDRPDRGRRRAPRRVQGHVHASTARRGPRTSAGSPRRRPLQAKEIARLQTCRRPLRRQGHQGGDGPQHGEADRPPRGRAGRRAEARRQARCACGSPIRRRQRRDGDRRRTGCAKAYGGPPVFEDVDVRPRPRRAAARARAQRRRQDQPAAHPRRRDRRPTSGTFDFGHNVTVGYYAQEHDNLRADAVAARQHPRRGADRASCSPRPSCAACSA